MTPLAAFEEIIDASGTTPAGSMASIRGVRARQLLVRTLLLGMLLVLADHRPAHLTRVHHALITLPEDDQRRLGVIADWKHRPHQLTYRQTEYTFGLVAKALGKDEPGGLPPPELQAICDDLLEASVPAQFKDASSSLVLRSWSAACPLVAVRASGPSSSSGRGVPGQYRLPLLMIAPSWVPLGPRSCGCRSWMRLAPAARSGSAQASASRWA